MKSLSLYAVLFIVCSSAVSVFAYNGHFVTGPIHTFSAENVNRGAVQLSGTAGLFNHHEIFTGVNNIESGYIVWDTKTAAQLNWGVLDHLQVGALSIISQSTHTDSARHNVPADLWLSAQLGSFGYGKARYGIRTDVRLPIAEQQNVPLHAYSADCMSFALMGLYSFQISSNFRIDANLGAIQHQDKGLYLPAVSGDSVEVAANSMEIFLGSAVHYFWQEYSFFAELRSRGFLNAPPPNAYARENSAHLSFGFTYQFNEWVQIVASYDKLLFGKEDVTSYLPERQSAVQKFQSVSNYPDWKFNIGVAISFRKGTPRKIKQRQVKQKSHGSNFLAPKREKTIIRETAIGPEKELDQEDLQNRQSEEREKMHDLLLNLRQTLVKAESD